MNPVEPERLDMSGLPAGLADLVAQAGTAAKLRPVDRWNPPDCGEIDMRIAADGAWLYRGSAIGRESLVRLFASILRREPDGSHVLVTPVEKIRITVDDAPFAAVGMVSEGRGTGRVISVRTNVGDIVEAGAEHPFEFVVEPAASGLKPYLHVRGGLRALLTRSLALDLVDLGEEHHGMLGVWSKGCFFALP